MVYVKRITPFVLAMTLIVSCLPFNVSFSNGKADIERSVSMASPVVVPGAAFLEEMAAACGLTSSQFIATIAGVTAASSGMAIGTETGIRLGASLSNNLNNLIEAADYPAYESLAEEDKLSWGSKENYDSAKFNSLMEAFDLGDDRDRFYSSGGANFEFSENAQERLEQLGRIGTNWVAGAGNAVQDIMDSLQPEYMQVFERYYGVTSFKEINKEDFDTWPSNAPNSLYVSSGSYFYYEGVGEQRRNYYQRASSNDVIWIPCFDDAKVFTYAYSKDGFMYGQNQKYINEANPVEPPQLTPVTLNLTSSSVESLGKQFYGVEYSTTFQNNLQITNNNMPINTYPGVSSINMRMIAAQILFGEDLGIGALPVDVEGYPENIEDLGEQQPIYYPSEGIYTGVPWSDLTTEPGQGGSGEGGGVGTDYTSLLQRIIALLERNNYDSIGDLKVIDNTVASLIRELISTVNGFVVPPGKDYSQALADIIDYLEDDLGLLIGTISTNVRNGFSAVDDDLNAIKGSLAAIIAILVTPDVPDLIGDFDFASLATNSAELVNGLDRLAPFGAGALISALIAVWSNVDQVQVHSFEFPFGFFGDETLSVDVGWLEGAKPIIDFCMITLLIWCLANASIRVIEMESTR